MFIRKEIKTFTQTIMEPLVMIINDGMCIVKKKKNVIIKKKFCDDNNNISNHEEQ